MSSWESEKRKSDMDEQKELEYMVQILASLNFSSTMHKRELLGCVQNWFDNDLNEDDFLMVSGGAGEGDSEQAGSNRDL